MANDILSRKKKRIFLAINNFFGPNGSLDVKQPKMNVAILMQNQNLQQTLMEQNTKVTNITWD